MSTTAIQKVSPAPLETFGGNAMELSVDDVVRQVNKIQDIMKRVMQEGEHFGIVPGTKKPMLYKAGAEKLCFLFRLTPEFEREFVDLGGGHREYIVRCTLTHIPTGRLAGQGLGSCSTMESKYRWRTGEVVPTGKPVPQEYWTLRKDNPSDALEIIGGRGYAVRKIEGTWEIVAQGEKIENPDIADQFNTILKMSLKRALTSATLMATAASDCFTQDEELEEAMPENVGPPPEKPAPPLQKQSNGKPLATAKSDWHPTEKQIKRMFALKSAGGWSDDAFNNLLTKNGIAKPDDISSKTQYDMICGVLEKGSPKADTQESQPQDSNPKEESGPSRTEFCGKIDAFSRKHIRQVREVMTAHNYDVRAIPETPGLRSQIVLEIEEAIFSAAEEAGL
jgi:hypothetical protein